MATTKKAAKKAPPKASKKAAPRKAAPKKTAKEAPPKKGTKSKNKLGVKNSLVNNINARKKKNMSRSKKDSTIDKEQYDDMEKGWDKSKKDK